MTEIEEAAAAVVTARKALTAATHRVDAAEKVLREHQLETEADRIRAERSEHDYQLAADAHWLALGRLRATLQATPGVDHEHTEDDLRAAIRGFNLKARQERL
jgi:hypothetical protein